MARRVDALEILLGARVELGPHLAPVLVEESQRLGHLGLPEIAGVRDQDDLRVVQAKLASNLRYEVCGGGEDRRQRRLPIAGKSNVPDRAPVRRNVLQVLFLEYLISTAQHVAQLRGQHVEVDIRGSRRLCAVHLAVNATEIAFLVRAEVDADALADAMLKVEIGDELTTEESDILSKVIASLSPQAEETPEVEEEAKEPELNQAMLELKKKKLELLLKGIE